MVAAGDVARWPNAALRRGDARRALGQRHRDGRGTRPAALLAGEAGAARGALRPGAVVLDATSTTARSSSPAESGADDDVEVVVGLVEERRFVALYGRQGRLVGVLGMNRPRHVMRWRAMLEQPTSWTTCLAAKAAG